MNENAVVVHEEVTEALVVEYLDALGQTSSLLENEKKMFIRIAKEYGLNPFKREVYITAYGEGKYRKYSIITGYEVYLKRAERTGKLDGWNIRYEGEGKNLKAIVEIHRKDQKYPFSHEVYYTECCQYNKEGQPNAIWAKMPRFMTKKVAIGQAFRLCFPDDLGGMPYEEAELPQVEKNVTEIKEPENKIAPKNNSQNSNNSNGNSQKQKSQQEYINEMKSMMTSRNSDNNFYFNEKEQEVWQKMAMSATSMQEFLKVYENLKSELEKREAAYYNAIPFEETNPDGTRHFEDDIPVGKSAKNSEIKYSDVVPF